MEKIKKIGVIGAGIMGHGIAHVAALGGFDVIMQDIAAEVLKKSLRSIEQKMEKGIQLGKLTAEDKEGAVQKIEITTQLNKMAEVDFIIEAAPEDLKIKIAIFEELDRICPEGVIFTTNTSAKSITELASSTKRPDRFIGMHFFNPVHIMKLVEIVKGLETDKKTVQAVQYISGRMNKETVLINEYPGFVTSRINALIGNEAFYMLMEGVGSAEDIDKAIKLGLNHPMGPFEMIDLVGLDTRLKVLEYLHESLGEKYRPCPLLVKYVKAGRLGRKVGRGVYQY